MKKIIATMLGLAFMTGSFATVNCVTNENCAKEQLEKLSNYGEIDDKSTTVDIYFQGMNEPEKQLSGEDIVCDSAPLIAYKKDDGSIDYFKGKRSVRYESKVGYYGYILKVTYNYEKNSNSAPMGELFNDSSNRFVGDESFDFSSDDPLGVADLQCHLIFKEEKTGTIHSCPLAIGISSNGSKHNNVFTLLGFSDDQGGKADHALQVNCDDLTFKVRSDAEPFATDDHGFSITGLGKKDS